MTPHQRGQCPGWWGGEYSVRQCRLCYLTENPLTRGQYAGTPTTSSAPIAKRVNDKAAILARVKPCWHRGEVMQRPSCGCSVYTCVEFGSCVPLPTVDGVRDCLSCDSYDHGKPVPDSQLGANLSPATWRRLLRCQYREWPAEALASPGLRRALVELADDSIEWAWCPEISRPGPAIVTCGGGRYDASLYVLVRMVRATGCEMPVQIWFNGEQEPVSPSVAELPGVELRDTSKLPGLRARSGWALKTSAMLNSGYAEFMFIDADAYPVVDVTPMFEANRSGLVVFPDRTFADGWMKRPTYGPRADWSHAPGPISGGHYFVRMADAWRVLRLAQHFDQLSDIYYRYQDGIGGYGDQDQMRAAIARLRAPFEQWSGECLYSRGVFRYLGPDGKVAFVHRAARKFARRGVFPAPPRRRRELEREPQAWSFFAEWCKLNPITRPELREPPGTTSSGSSGCHKRVSGHVEPRKR